MVFRFCVLPLQALAESFGLHFQHFFHAFLARNITNFLHRSFCLGFLSHAFLLPPLALFFYKPRSFLFCFQNRSPLCIRFFLPFLLFLYFSFSFLLFFP